MQDKRLGEEEITAVTISEWKKNKINHQLFPVLSSVEEHRMKMYDLQAVGTTVTRNTSSRRIYSCLAEENRMWSGDTTVST